MTAIARSQSSSVSTPVLVAGIRDGGFLVDPYQLQYTIYDTSDDTKRLVPVKVFPVDPATKATVDLTNDRLGLGRYVALWSAGPAETLGRHMIRWFLTLESGGPVVSWDREFEVLAGAGYGSQLPPAYCMLCDLREQGISATTYSDAKLLLAAAEAAKLIERFTRRFFEPRYQSIEVDGRGGSRLLLEQPIVAVESVELTSPYIDDTDVDDAEYHVYNRHLDGVISPDDRENPQIGLAYAPEDVPQDEMAQSNLTSRMAWPRGKKNIRVTGLFGYTDSDGSPEGCTPREIVRVTMALVYRDLLTLTDGDREDRRLRHLVTSETTRDQSVGRKFGGDAKGGCTAFTGDPDIDGIILRYCRPPFLGAA